MNSVRRPMQQSTQKSQLLLVFKSLSTPLQALIEVTHLSNFVIADLELDVTDAHEYSVETKLLPENQLFLKRVLRISKVVCHACNIISAPTVKPKVLNMHGAPLEFDDDMPEKNDTTRLQHWQTQQWAKGCIRRESNPCYQLASTLEG